MKLLKKGGRPKAEGGNCFHPSRCAHHFPLPLSPVPPRSGITLIEVLISMFVLLFGLMGVAAIFPVASHYILEGDKRDRSSGLAQLAFEELQARKVLQPKIWFYADHTDATPNDPSDDYPAGSPFINAGGAFNVANMGNAFLIDPLGAAQVPGTQPVPRTTYPYDAPSWSGSMLYLPDGINTTTSWPIRRMTLPTSFNPDNLVPPVFVLNSKNAETIFRLRDDLSVEQPDAGDRPSIQRWQTSGGQLLSRDYTGDYSWLATVVPTSSRALMGLQPAANIKDGFYEVTTVVFYKRDIVPSTSAPGSPGSERLIAAEFLNESELAIYDANTTDSETIESALDGIKPTNWIAVMGVNQITGTFMMKWYKVQAMDDETSPVQLKDGSTVQGRYVMVQGADWPKSSYNNLQVAILPGAIDAYTRVMQVDVE